MGSGKKAFYLSSGLAAAGIAAGVMSLTVANQLADIALNREAPHKITPSAARRFTGTSECDSFFHALEEGRQKLEARAGETVTILTSDGIRLIGHWIPCKKPRRAIVAMHGWRSCWSRDFGLICDFFAESGCSVLYAEQRGQQGSGGEFMGLGILERYDCLQWIHKVNDLTGTSLPIYLGGISMGAATVLMAAGLELPKNVRGIIADCGFTSAWEMGRHILRNNLHLPFRFTENTADRLFRRKIRISSRNCSTTEALKKTQLPVLLIHGTEDPFVPVRMSYENYAACGGPRELVVFPGAGHGMSYFSDPERYESAIRNFFRQYDP